MDLKTRATFRFQHLYRYRYTFVGFLMGIGAPAGWFVWRFLYTQRDHFVPWSINEITHAIDLYSYLISTSVVMFTLFGYFLGRRVDQLRTETQVTKKLLDKLNTQATTDGLTGLKNQRTSHEHLAMEYDSAHRYGTPLTVILFDVDNFKSINDTYGHPFGDEVLVAIANKTKLLLRRVDFAGRVGGEEFLLILPHTPSPAGEQVSERVREAVANLALTHQGKIIPVTISLGVVTFHKKNINSKLSLFKAADDALYQAKHSGKNRTAVWQPAVKIPA